VFVLLLACAACRNRKPAPAAVQYTVPATEITVADPVYRSRLLRGFFDGDAAWKWTGWSFAVALDVPEPPQPTLLMLDFVAPDELMAQLSRGFTLTATVNGDRVGKAKYEKVGRTQFVVPVPASALTRSPAEIEFALDQTPKWTDGRPLGVIVLNVGLRPREEAVLNREMTEKAARDGYMKLLEQRKLRLAPEKQNELMKLFHDIPVWQHTFFHNVQIEKNPLDLWMMQQIIYEIQPDFVVETGTWRGGSALYWAHTLNGMGLDQSRVITVDIQDQTKTAATHPFWKRVTFLQGSSTDPKIVADIARMVQGRKVIVTLDSDHSMRHVLNELHAYAPMVSSRSYLVVEDTHIDGVPTQPDAGPGPLAAVQAFLKEDAGKDFAQDLTREAFIMTFNPGGWLRRK
jgi:cephalosporin hydroxylase